MKADLFTHSNDPGELEKMYRINKLEFKREFRTIYPELKGRPLADFWYERLNYESDEISLGTNTELFFVIIASFLAGIIAKTRNSPGLTPNIFIPGI